MAVDSVDRPRIVFVTTVFNEVQNGPGIYTHYLWRAFADHPQFEFHIVAPWTIHRVEHPRIHYVRCEGGSLKLYAAIQDYALSLTEGRTSQTLIHGNAAHSMYRFVNYEGPWIVQVNDYEAAESRHRALAVLRKHGWRRLLSLLWRRRQEKRVLGKATRIVCNSDYTRSMIQRLYGAATVGQRALTIHKAVATRDFAASTGRDPLEDQPKHHRMMYLGANWRLKGLPTLLDAIARLKARFPDVRLVIGGPSSQQDQDQIRELASQLDVAEHVIMPGRIDRSDLPRWFAHCDLFVMPTHIEAFGVSILEAMSAGLPVIASRVGGIPEIIASSEDGTLLEAGQPEQWAAAIEAQFLDPEHRRRLSIRGPKRALDFDVQPMIEKVSGLYRQLLLKESL